MNDNEQIPDTAVEALFVTMECRDMLRKSLANKENRNNINTGISFSQLVALAENRGGAQTKEWWQIVNASQKLQEDFRTILLHSGSRTQPLLVAAASDEITERIGEHFDLMLHMSSKNDGSAYLVISFHEDASQPFNYLFAKDSKGYHMIELPNPVNGLVQVLLDPNHPVKNAFADVTAEFFIK